MTKPLKFIYLFGNGQGHFFAKLLMKFTASKRNLIYPANSLMEYNYYLRINNRG